MRATMILSVLLAAMPAGAWSQMERSGRAHVIDGDSLYVGYAEVRLFGIDSPEYEQTCELAGGGSWACDEAATSLLKRLAKDRVVACKSEGLDRHDRVIATCWADGVERGERLVAAGLSWAYRQYSMRYATAEAGARAAGQADLAGRLPAVTGLGVPRRPACRTRGGGNARMRRGFLLAGRRTKQALAL